MAFSDYKTNPPANLQIGDEIYIGPNMARNDVREALQQLAADGKGLSNDVGVLASTGVNTDPFVRGDLASTDSGKGAALVAFIQSGIGSVARTAQAKMRERLSVADKSGALLAQLESVGTDLVNGGNCFLPRGNHTLTGTFDFTGHRLNLSGEGENVSIINFNPASADVAINIDRSDAGGPYQCCIEKLGFYSVNTVDKTAIRLDNTANSIVSRVNIANNGWQGSDSIGIHVLGRQFVKIDRCVIGCARPVLFDVNATFPSLATDHCLINECELIGLDSSKPVVEFADGTSFANMTIKGCGIIQGKDGVRWVDTGGSVSAGFHFHMEDVRFEQGLDSTGYSVRLETTNNSVQEALFVNVRFDANRHGVYLRKCLRVTFINCTFDNSGKTALDMTMVSGSRLEFVNCTGTGTFTITDGVQVSGSGASRALGFSEVWVYNTGALSGRNQFSNAPRAANRANVANAGRVKICDNSFSGKVHIHQRANGGADFDVRGSGNVAYRLSGTDISNIYTETLGTASKRNFGYDGSGADGAGYYLENNSGGAADFVWTLEGSGW